MGDIHHTHTGIKESLFFLFLSVQYLYHADSGIVMVDGCSMVDWPCVNHAEKAVNHVLWLTGFGADG